jgi:hypothetical protein
MGSVRNSDGNIRTVGTIYFGIGKIDKLMQRKEGGVAIAGILAHECAHIFQFYSTYEKRLEGPTRVLMELHADTLAGYYMAKRPDPRIEKLAIFAEALRDLGSYDSADEYFHGTPGQRHVALEKGYFLSKKGLSFTDAANEAANYVKTLLF